MYTHTHAHAEVPLAEWRHRVARAKRKAMLIISVVLAFRGRRHRARGLQRLDSLSYFIAQHLADQLPRFVDEQGSYRAGKASVANLQVGGAGEGCGYQPKLKQSKRNQARGRTGRRFGFGGGKGMRGGRGLCAQAVWGVVLGCGYRGHDCG